MMNPVQLLPEYPVTTARLRLRPLSSADVQSLLGYRSLEQVCRYVPFEPMSEATIGEMLAGRWSRTRITAEGDALTLGVELSATRRLVGDVMLALRSVEHRGGEIGWVFDPAHSGNGYATEAAHAVLHLAFDQLGLHRVVARVDARNDASLRLAERLGMRREAHLISNEWFKGAWGDEVDFAILEEEWALQHSAGSSVEPCSWRYQPVV
jgi:RimJ/RimL family protein N-acetyltransferase